MAFDVGCYECGEPSGVIGFFATEADAAAACSAAAERQKRPTCPFKSTDATAPAPARFPRSPQPTPQPSRTWSLGVIQKSHRSR